MTQTTKTGSVLDLILKGTIDLDPDDVVGDAPSPPKKWRNRWKWRHPTDSFQRPDGIVPPGGEFFTRGIYPSKEVAEQRADEQMYDFTGNVKSWPPQVRLFLQYMGAHKVED